MPTTITIDPVTRIEGHLRLEAELTDNVVTKAWSSAQMWRGIELVLRGRDPQDAWIYAQRLCGVCTTVHAISSIRAVEHACGVEVPLNAQLVRNIMMAQHSVQDHLVHFYHLTALDWVDMVAALRADPAAAVRFAQSISDWPGNSLAEFKAVQARLQRLVESGQLGIFASGYWGHPAMELPPEVNLVMVAHYLNAFDYQRKAAQAVAVLGGKNPHIQNLVVGGVATAINVGSMAALNMERFALLRSLMEESRAFLQQVFYPDLLALAGAYKSWFAHGGGVRTLLAVPEFPEDPVNTRFALHGGLMRHGENGSVRAIRDHRDPLLLEGMRESVARSWYADQEPLHPWAGETEPEPATFDPTGKYSWCKAPRLNKEPVQVGPLAQILINYALGQPQVKSLVDAANAKLGITLSEYHSTMGRMLARGMRAWIMADLSLEYLDKLLANLAAGDAVYARPAAIPGGEFRGVGFHEAPRGSLSHWIVIKDQKIANYQAVVPSTWNASPRDESGRPGPYEAALEGVCVVQADKPLEILRTLHSFDPCLACAVHMIDPSGREITQVQVR